MPPGTAFDAQKLMMEQAALLSTATPGDINLLHFLRIRLNARQRRTAQRNQWMKALQEGDGTYLDASSKRNSMNGWTQQQQFGAHSVTSQGHHTGYNDPLGADASLTSDRHANPRNERNDLNASNYNYDGDFSLENSNPSAMREDSRRFSSAVEDMHASIGTRRSVSDSMVQAQHSTAFSEAIGVQSLPHSIGKKASTFDEKPAVASGKSHVLDEAETMEIELQACPHCGRKFAPDRLERHYELCKRQKEREALRVKTDKQSQLLESSKILGSQAGGNGASGGSPTWRKQSTLVREGRTADVQVDDEKVLCPYCSRRFGQEAAARHISLCKEKSSRAH